MSRRTALFLAGGVVVALVLAFGVSRYASSQPDGLNKVASDTRIAADERPHEMADSPFAGYSTRGIASSGTSKGVAGVVGVVVVFVLAGGVVVIAGRRRRAAPG
jgi:hypothetical protein